MTKRRRNSNRFLTGILVGAGGAVGSMFLADLILSRRHHRVIRLENGIQIGRPVKDVFEAWADVGRFAEWSSLIRSVERQGDRSHWVVNINGRRIEWDSEIEQFIPDQAIGWKSLNGPKHTGRISFTPVGNDTLIHVTMNYAPPSRLLRPIAHAASDQIESYLDRVLREFKAALEDKGRRGTMPNPDLTDLGPTSEAGRATGTLGRVTEGITRTQHTRFGGPPTPIEGSRPPESKS